MIDINIIDIEASGLHFDSYPIELAVLINGRSKSWLIKPEKTWLYWCSTAESMHGISREILKKGGLSASQVVDEFMACIESANGILYSDAAHWDADWMSTLFSVVNMEQLFHIESIYDLLEKNQIPEFNKTKARLSESDKYRQHRAEEDVRIIYQAWIEASEK